MLKEGDLAPRFELPDAEMEMVSLDSFLGKHAVVVFFYVKDDTPGCTIEAIDFSELEDAFRRHDTIVLGISRDDCLSHGAFRDKHGLDLELLSDVDGQACSDYGVLVERDFDGMRKQCVRRSTFVLDREGRVHRAMYGVSPRGHALEILNVVKGMK
ncbi:MAG: redoxin domain-containing protein [Betaproteobacteria bacterium]|nr:redoxin domain-containing protein [Betaproteobacteria bacterium]